MLVIHYKKWFERAKKVLTGDNVNIFLIGLGIGLLIVAFFLPIGKEEESKHDDWADEENPIIKEYYEEVITKDEKDSV